MIILTVCVYYILYTNIGYNTYMDIKTRIEELRLKKGLSIYELTVKSGLSENTIYHWYNELSSPSLKGIMGICKALDITLEEFFCPLTKDALSYTQKELVELFDGCTKEEQEAILVMLRMKKEK